MAFEIDSNLNELDGLLKKASQQIEELQKTFAEISNLEVNVSMRAVYNELGEEE